MVYRHDSLVFLFLDKKVKQRGFDESKKCR